jgi:glycine/D-amino acid oxidase-like deaminating enzyme
MKDYDVAGGWAGMGIVAGYAAAQAYADWIVHGDDTNLKLFEEMQPGKFESTHKQPTPATRRPTADTPAVA